MATKLNIDADGVQVSLTDIAKYRTAENPGYVIQNWMRTRFSQLDTFSHHTREWQKTAVAGKRLAISVLYKVSPLEKQRGDFV